MAKNEIKVNITAETTAFERNIATLKSRLSTLFDTHALSLNAVNPLTIASRQAAKIFNAIIDSFKNWRKGLEDISTATEKTAKDLDTTTLQASRLEAAARAAGVSAKDYAAALDNIKAGKTNLEIQAQQWERIAGSAKTAQERARSFAALIEAERKQQHDQATAAEKITATLSGLEGSGTIAQSFLGEIQAGRSATITGQEFAKRGAQLGISYRNMGGNETIDLALKALNRAIQEEIAARSRAAEKEAKAKEEAEQKAADERLKTLEAEEAAQKAAMDRVRAHERELEAARAKATAAAQAQQAALDAAARKAYTLGNTLHQAYGGDAWAKLEELLGPDARALYDRGARLIETPEKQAEDQARAEIARREERAAKRDTLEQEKATLEQSLSAYQHPLSRPDFITAAGGSLIGDGAFSLQQAKRLAALDKDDTQREQLAQLKAINERLKALDE